MQTLLQDIRYGLRTLLNKPGFTLVTVITLALGIGANTAIFSVINAVLLKPLPYREPDRLLALRSNESVPNLTDIRSWTSSFEEVGGTTFQPLDYTSGSEPEQWLTGLVTGGYFKTLGIQPILGRVIDYDDDKPGGERIVVLSNEMWKERFNADRGIIGRTIQLSGQTYVVTGVMPEGFKSPREDVVAWAPVQVASPDAAPHRGVHFLRVYLRLKEGATIDRAMEELRIVDKRLIEAYPEEEAKRRAILLPLKDRIVGETRRPLYILFGAVGMVLLIACSNFANLLLARAASREQELIIRAALGAGRWRLIRQWLTESVMIGLLGGAVALLFAQWSIDLLLSLKPENYVRLDNVRLDGRVLLFTLSISILTGVIFGLIPAWKATRFDPGQSLKEGGRGTAGAARHRLRSGLTVIEIALALMLLIGAGLLLRSFSHLYNIHPGFNPDELMTMRIELPETRYKEIPQQMQFRRALIDDLNALPGARAAMVSELPLAGDLLNHNFQIEGRDPVATGAEPDVDTRSLAGEYFSVMQIPLIAGRDFAAQDSEKAPLVGIINESLRNQFFRNEDPIGKRVRWARDEQPNWITIIGVAGDVKHYGLNLPDAPALYTPYAQVNRPWKRWMTVVVRSGDGNLSANAIKNVVWKRDSRLPVKKVRTMSEVVAESVGEQKFNTLLLGFFALLALVLALVGIYGVMSFIVSNRSREIGVRMALGAQSNDILKMVTTQGMKLALGGVAIGLPAAFVLTRLMESLLFGVNATDWVTFALVTPALLLVALLACWIPARRAAKVDPMIALRYE